MINRPRTIVSDIDGLIFKYQGDIKKAHLCEPVVLPGVYDKFKEWDMEGCHIILMTGRRESVRKETERQLSEAGIFYDHLIMNVGGGLRFLINDRKSDGSLTAQAFSPPRNEGLKNAVDFRKRYRTKPEEVSSYTDKPWGSETLIETNSQYTVKKLFMKEGHRCSLQYHEKKHETVYILSGVMKLWIGKDKDRIEAIIMGEGDDVVIEPGVVHRMEAVSNCVYLESSTSELGDVVRVEDDYGRKK